MTVIVRPCPKCKTEKKMTKHHVFPVRHFGRGKHNQKFFLLCRACHDDLEKLIPYQVMPRAFYTAIIKVFIIMEKE